MCARLFLVGIVSLLPHLSSASEESEIKSAMEQARHPKGEFKAMLDYRMAALNLLGERLDRALGKCTTDRKLPLSFDIVLFIQGSGKVDRVLYWPKSAFGACLAQECKSLHFAPPKYPPYPLPLKLTKS